MRFCDICGKGLRLKDGHWEQSKTRKMELFAKIVNGWMLLTIFTKIPNLVVLLGSEYVFGLYMITRNYPKLKVSLKVPSHQIFTTIFCRTVLKKIRFSDVVAKSENLHLKKGQWLMGQSIENGPNKICGREPLKKFEVIWSA